MSALETTPPSTEANDTGKLERVAIPSLNLYAEGNGHRGITAQRLYPAGVGAGQVVVYERVNAALVKANESVRALMAERATPHTSIAVVNGFLSEMVTQRRRERVLSQLPKIWEDQRKDSERTAERITNGTDFESGYSVCVVLASTDSHGQVQRALPMGIGVDIPFVDLEMTDVLNDPKRLRGFQHSAPNIIPRESHLMGDYLSQGNDNFDLSAVNRRILLEAMTAAGFVSNPKRQGHFSLPVPESGMPSRTYTSEQARKFGHDA